MDCHRTAIAVLHHVLQVQLPPAYLDSIFYASFAGMWAGASVAALPVCFGVRGYGPASLAPALAPITLRSIDHMYNPVMPRRSVDAIGRPDALLSPHVVAEV